MEEDYVMIPGSGTKKIIRDVKKEIETAFLDYSMSVIVSRARESSDCGLAQLSAVWNFRQYLCQCAGRKILCLDDRSGQKYSAR